MLLYSDMKIFDVKRSAVLVLSILMLGFVFSDIIQSADFGVENWIAGARSGVGIRFFESVTFLMNSSTAIFLTIMLSLYLWSLISGRSFFYLKVLWLSMGAGAFSEIIIKNIAERERPLGYEEFFQALSFSFPSGHSIGALLFFGWTAILLLKFLKTGKGKKMAILGTCILMTALVGFSRVYLGLHYASDVLGGYMIGWFWFNAGLSVIKYIPSEKTPKLIKNLFL